MKTRVDLTVDVLSTARRIDSYLAQKFSNAFSRVEIKRCLVDGKILLNGRKAKPRTPLKQGDRVTGELDSVRIITATAQSLPIQVIHEDKELFVIDKPSGLVVHPGAGHSKGTLVNALLGRQARLSTVGGPLRPGIVHRLDKDTSGLLLVAKSNYAHRMLQSQFASRSLSKTYLALVRGQIEYEEGRVEAPIGRDKKVKLKMSVSASGDGKYALTLYRVLRRFHHATLLEIKLVTGRTHQIRVHMRHLGHPVAGDTLYGGPREASEPRLALHAAKIEFLHPKTGKLMTFESPIPAEMKAMIEKAERE